MNVVVLIEGREALPVRAIPLLANWRFMSPDIVAHVLGGTGGSNVGLFGDMQSNRIEDGKVQHLKKDYWVQFPLMELQALSEKIKADESSHVVGYSEWRKQSLKVLPAGVFVWKDEYQALHDKNWNSRYKMTYCALRDWNSEGEAEESDEENESHIQRQLTREESVEGIALKRDLRESLEILNRWREPSYSPFMLPELCAVVMEGFEQPSLEDHQTIQSLLDERDKLIADIKRWESKDESQPSETLIKEKELERLRARLAEVEEKLRVLRGDYQDTSEAHQSVASSSVLNQVTTIGAEEIDFTMVATRQQLIDAFGTFTGMDKSWFDNLTTSPKLMAARKCKGQGGRYRAEPLFCPYEVMQWLADPKRKKGRRLSDTKAWLLLKNHFPKVYNKNSIGDPSTD